MPQLLQTIFVVSVIAGSAIVWSVIISRWRRGLPALPYQPRRPVPWTAVDLALVLLIFLSASLIADGFGNSQDSLDDRPLDIDRLKLTLILDTLIKLLTSICAVVWVMIHRRATLEDFGLVPSKIAADVRLGVASFVALVVPVLLIQFVMTQLTPSRHPLTTALLENPDAVMWALTILAAVVTAPWVEEFAFRLLFQGWMESVVSHYRRISTPAAVVADQQTPSGDEPETTAEPLLDRPPVATAELADAEEAINPFASPRAHADDKASPPANEAEDEAGLERTAWGPIVLSATAFSLMHVAHGPDIVALLVLALGLGYLYQRTHRILPCIIVHLCLNATSVWMLWLSLVQ